MLSNPGLICIFLIQLNGAARVEMLWRFILAEHLDPFSCSEGRFDDACLWRGFSVRGGWGWRTAFVQCFPTWKTLGPGKKKRKKFSSRSWQRRRVDRTFPADVNVHLQILRHLSPVPKIARPFWMVGAAFLSGSDLFLMRLKTPLAIWQLSLISEMLQSMTGAAKIKQKFRVDSFRNMSLMTRFSPHKYIICKRRNKSE